MAASNSVPAGLAGVLNRPEEQQQRDSAYYSAVDSKRKHSFPDLRVANSTLGADRKPRYLDAVQCLDTPLLRLSIFHRQDPVANQHQRWPSPPSVAGLGGHEPRKHGLSHHRYRDDPQTR